jgi:hypothetical protein
MDEECWRERSWATEDVPASKCPLRGQTGSQRDPVHQPQVKASQTGSRCIRRAAGEGQKLRMTKSMRKTRLRQGYGVAGEDWKLGQSESNPVKPGQSTSGWAPREIIQK